jgi:hypothetical protein
LFGRRLDVQVVPEDAEGEDGQGEAIAAEAWVAAGELGESLVVVFCGALVSANLY